MMNSIGELRASQLVTTFGPGAIVDLPDLSVIVASHEYWDTSLCRNITEPRLAARLGVNQILAPPLPKDGQDKVPTLPAFRFPLWFVCPECRKLGRENQFQKDINTGAFHCLCTPSKPRVFPSRFIVACSLAHMDDFPWSHYVHADKSQSKKDCTGRDLKLLDDAKTGAISDLVVRCEYCDISRPLDEAFSREGWKLLGTCNGSRHWLGPGERENCKEHLRAMLRGASNLYFPVVVSALSIPPYTAPEYTAICRILDRLSGIESLEDLRTVMKIGSILHELAGFTPEEVWEALQNQRGIPVGKSLDLLYPEWEAILRGSSPDTEHEFETEEQEVPTAFRPWVSRLITLKRVVEVRALEGFTRIDPPPDAITMLLDENHDADTPDVKPAIRIASLGHKSDCSWLPGIMTRGEGIFLALKEEELQKWERKVDEAGRVMGEAFRHYCEDRQLTKHYKPHFPGVRYVLLHSLAHALMRQLCLDSGYSHTSLRERIYARSEEECSMAGLLIYTATPDSEGSLGGLVDLGRTNRFESVLWNSLQDTALCSADPLCAEHTPGMIGDLNGAACHACLLAPETSCERANRFLDRSFLVSTVSVSKQAFFNL